MSKTRFMKGIQFEIEREVWDKFLELAVERDVKPSQIIRELVLNHCATNSSPADIKAGRVFPDLIGSDVPAVPPA